MLGCAYRASPLTHAAARAAVLSTLAFASACGDDGDDDAYGGACSYGFSLMSEIYAQLERDPPSCQSTADCMTVSGGLECAGSSVGDCGMVIHKAQFELYETAHTSANRRFCAAAKKSKYGCWAGPSCLASVTVCEQGRCTSSVPGLADSGTAASP